MQINNSDEGDDAFHRSGKPAPRCSPCTKVVLGVSGLFALGAIITTCVLMFGPAKSNGDNSLFTHSLPQESVADLQKARIVYISPAQSFADACNLDERPEFCSYDISLGDSLITPLGETQLSEASTIMN